MKTIARVQQAPNHSVRRQIKKISFRRRRINVLSRMHGAYGSPQSDSYFSKLDFAWDSICLAKSSADLLAAISANFDVLTQSGVVDQQLIESFPARLRNAARIYTSGQHTFAVGRVCVMGNAMVTAIGSMAHVKATGHTKVILDGATASVAEGVFVLAHSGARVRRITPNSL